MNKEQAQKVLDELNEVRPEMLNDEAKRLFETIMKIANERDKLRKAVKKQDLEISSLKQIHDYDIKMIDDVKGKAIELYNRIDERDEIINLMAKMINNHDIDEDICKQMGQKENCNEFEDEKMCVECIVQYFRERIKEKEV